MKNYPFNTAYSYIREQYGIEINPDEFETLGMMAWDKIGNKNTTIYRYVATPEERSEKTWWIDLPCNCNIVEAVSATYEDYQKTSTSTIGEDVISMFGEAYIESRKFNTGELYNTGKFIKFQQIGNSLKIKDSYSRVNILYQGIEADDEGLPYINSKEADAIAAYCAYTYFYKKALQVRDNGTVQMSQALKQDWMRLCSAARVSEYINQNDMNRILDVKTSWDRKRFGKSYKPER